MYCLLVGFIALQRDLYSNFRKLLNPPPYTHGWGVWGRGNKMRIGKSLIIVRVSKEHMSRTWSKMQLMYILYLPVQKLYLFTLKLFSHFSENILTLLKNIYLYALLCIWEMVLIYWQVQRTM